jgi:hypothetical protein
VEQQVVLLAVQQVALQLVLLLAHMALLPVQ